MSKIKKACSISPAVRQTVLDRDGRHCFICGSTQNLQIAHYISRARLGIGIPENLGTLCIACHYSYDNGKYHNEIKDIFKGHLKAHYPNWDESNLTYKKWSF